MSWFLVHDQLVLKLDLMQPEHSGIILLELRSSGPAIGVVWALKEVRKYVPGPGGGEKVQI